MWCSPPQWCLFGLKNHPYKPYITFPALAGISLRTSAIPYNVSGSPLSRGQLSL